MLKLLVCPPGKPAFTVELSELRTALGRSVRNGVCLEDAFASRVHAEIRREGNTYQLTDLGSANGTLVNGVRVNGTIPIGPGDRLQIGESLIDVQPLSAESPEARLTIVGRLFSANEVAASPEAVVTAPEPSASGAQLLSVIETIRQATGAETIPVAIEHSKALMAVISRVGLAL